MSEEMIGRRLPIAPGQDPLTVLERPGDYCGPVKGYSGDRPAVFFLLPTANPEDPFWAGGEADGLHHVTAPPHTFRECADGSVEIRESIGAYKRLGPRDGGFVWHGYLDEGHSWRQV